jgi:hypothetical protein
MIYRRVSVFGVLTAVGLAASGCVGVHLYRKADHDLALKAQASFTDAKLTEMSTEERKRLDEMLQMELKASRRQLLATRDADLLAIVGETKNAWPNLADAIQARIEKLVGPRAAAAVIAAHNEADAAQDQLARTANAYGALRAASDPAPTCPPLTDLPSVSPKAKVIFGLYQSGCQRYLSARDALAKAGGTGSLWAKLNEQAEAAERNKAAYESELKTVQAAYEAEKRQYDAAVKSGQGAPLASLADRVRGALETLGKPLTSANAAAAEKELARLGVADLNLQGLVQVLEERRRALADLLGPAPTDEKPDPAGGKPAAPTGGPLARAIAASLPSIDAFLSKGQAPPVTALVLEAENLRLQREGLKRRIAAADKQIALLFAERDAIREEVRWLTKASRSVAEVRTNCKPTGDLAADLQSLLPSCRENGLRALIFYANSWNLGRVVEDQVRYTRIAGRHASALDASDTALAQWQNLIAVPMSQLVAYHGSGIKPEDIVALMQALGVGGIAVGVNR